MTGLEQTKKILMSYMEPCTCSNGYDGGEPIISACPICNGDRYLRKKEVQVDWTEELGEMIEKGQVKFPGIKSV